MCIIMQSITQANETLRILNFSYDALKSCLRGSLVADLRALIQAHPSLFECQVIFTIRIPEGTRSQWTSRLSNNKYFFKWNRIDNWSKRKFLSWITPDKLNRESSFKGFLTISFSNCATLGSNTSSQVTQFTEKLMKTSDDETQLPFRVINKNFSHTRQTYGAKSEAVWVNYHQAMKHSAENAVKSWNVSIIPQLPPYKHMFQHLKVSVNKILFVDQHKFRTHRNEKLLHFTLAHIVLEEKQFYYLFPHEEFPPPQNPRKRKVRSPLFTFVWWIFHRLAGRSRARFCQRLLACP